VDQFRAAGYPGDVTGVIYRRATPATNGMPLGGVDTGCVDLETSGMWGYSTLFNSHVPRRGPINAAAFGLSVGGKTWVLCDPSQAKRYDTTDGRMPEDTPPEARAWRASKPRSRFTTGATIPWLTWSSSLRRR
jgi:hypothetical protein